MKMLLASDDITALQPLARRLLASGIPIALQKPSGLSPYLEVWIQRDGDFSLARTMLPTGSSMTAAAQSVSAEAGSAGRQSGNATTTGTSITVSGFERLLHRFWR